MILAPFVIFYNYEKNYIIYKSFPAWDGKAFRTGGKDYPVWSGISFPFRRNMQPVSWTIGTAPSADLVNTMLDIAIEHLPQGAHPIIHTDRGSHYRWPGWIDRMNKANLTRSMSRKGCSPDNAACEAFFGRLKTEMFYNHSWINVSLEEFVNSLDNYIHWYASGRIKMSLGAMSPMEYRRSLGLVS